MPSAIPYMRNGVKAHLFIAKDPKVQLLLSPWPKHLALSGDIRMPTIVRDKIYKLQDKCVLIALNTA